MPGSVAARPCRKTLADANVNESTGLATDYLNVFNEPLLMIGLAGSNPDMLEELETWSAPDYEAHFEGSGLDAREVILAAYRATDAQARADFQDVCSALEKAIHVGVSQLQGAASAGGDVAALAAVVSERLQGYVAKLDAMIHGRLRGALRLDEPSAAAGDA